MTGHSAFSEVAINLARIYFFVSGLGEIIVGGVLVYREEGLLFWFGISALIGGVFSVAFAIWEKDNPVAKAAQDSIDDADPPADAPVDTTGTLEPASRPLDNRPSKRVAPLK